MNRIILKVLKKLGILKFFNLKGILLINHKSFRIPIFGMIGYENLSITEPWMIDLFKIILPIDNTKFIDIGVNIGQTLLKLKSVSTEIGYIGFEPNPVCIYYTSRLIETNTFKNTVIVPVAISEKTKLGVLSFFDSSTTNSSASIIDNFRPGQKVFNMEYVPLMDLESIKDRIKMKSMSILKIDVEGAELEVIKSFQNQIKNKKPIIIIEILPVYSIQSTKRIERQNSIIDLLSNLSYSMYRVIKENEILLNLKEIKEIGIHSDMNKCEYVFVPKSKKETFKNYTKQWLQNKDARS